MGNSLKLFNKILSDIGFDNSMGDFSSISFEFIDYIKAKDEFETFLIERFKDDLYLIGEHDGQDYLEGRIKKQRQFKNKILQEFYNDGWKASVEAKLI